MIMFSCPPSKNNSKELANRTRLAVNELDELELRTLHFPPSPTGASQVCIKNL